MAQKSFKDVGLAQWLVRALGGVGIHAPTEIQTRCVPPALAGNDIIGAAQTGSGKTLAFGLPMLQKLAEDPYGVFGLVLTPTRELAMQIADQFMVLGASCSLRLAIVVGGVDMMAQALELQRRPHVIIATPGRLADHIASSSGAVDLRRLQFLVLDEADRLLGNAGLASDLTTVLGALDAAHFHAHGQLLLFSATLRATDAPVEQLCALRPELKRRGAPVIVRAGSDPGLTVESEFSMVQKLDQRLVLCPAAVRNAYLVHLLSTELAGKVTIIFANKRRTVEHLRVMLRELGFPAAALHAQMPQNLRTASLARFRSAQVPLLIATDVGSRGLDIPQAHAVVNYNLPLQPEDYVHRAGRTARAGRGGMCISFVGRHDASTVLQIEEATGARLDTLDVDEDQALKRLNKITQAARTATLSLLEHRFGERERVNRAKALRG